MLLRSSRAPSTPSCTRGNPGRDLSFFLSGLAHAATPVVMAGTYGGNREKERGRSGTDIFSLLKRETEHLWLRRKVYWHPQNLTQCVNSPPAAGVFFAGTLSARGLRIPVSLRERCSKRGSRGCNVHKNLLQRICFAGIAAFACPLLVQCGAQGVYY